MIVQVGAVPPPIGGVTVYIKRMKDFLDSKNIANQVWDYSRIKKNEENVVNLWFPFIPFYYAINKDIKIIHYHIVGTMTKNYIGFFNRNFFKKRKKILTIHGACKGLFDRNRKLICKSLNSFDAIICMTNNDKKYLIENGIIIDIYDIPGFIPPTIKEQDIKEISRDVWNFINDHKPLISANASNISFYKQQDLYGIDMCIELCTNLKNEYPHIGFIFSIPSINDYEYFKTMKQRIIQNGIEDNFLFFTKPYQLYPILMKSDIFVRPTNTDGDAISIREALYLKIPTVASDVVPRPEGTLIFGNRDIEDFILKVKDIIINYNLYKEKFKRKEIENNAEKILEIYQKMTDINKMIK
jgi:hypothetical protein